MAYRDAFNPRPFQREVIKSVLDGFSSDRNVTVVLASPGSGKTLSYQAVATYLYREGLIDFAAIFVPRLTLARQCETDWMHRLMPAKSDGTYDYDGDHKLFDPRRRLGLIRHVPNKLPLTPPGQTGIGIVATYSALVKSPDIYTEEWAQTHRGRFLLVADEAQFCGTSKDDDITGGTAAGRYMTDLHQYAAHTLLLTGTPYRSDREPLILADYEPEDEEGKRKLVCHAEASYSTGVAEGYLRRFEATITNARVRRKYNDGTVLEYDLSGNGEDLREVMRKQDTWQPIVDGVVEAVQEKQRIHPDYRGLISCMEQAEAKRVRDYLANHHPRLRVVLSISEDGEEAERVLRDFKKHPADILVTVRKAFIGYDCKSITVVGILTHYRDWGHLLQLVGRGLRTWDAIEGRTQSCRVICSDDPQMEKFINFMRGESEQGLRERERREISCGGPGGVLPGTRDDELYYVESARATTTRAVSNDSDVDADDFMLLRAIKHDVGAVDDITVLKRVLDLAGIRLADMARTGQQPPASPDQRPQTPLTEQEQIDEVGVEVTKRIKEYLSSQGIFAKHPEYGIYIRNATNAVNKTAKLRAGDAWTLEQAHARLRAAERLIEQERELV